MEEYRKTDVSISIEQASVYSLLFAVPFLALFAVLFVARWGLPALGAGISALTGNLLSLLAVYFAGIAVHEGIHALGWAALGKKPLRAIHIGVQWKMLTPYAHIRAPIEVSAYRWGALLPGIITGLLPALTGLAIGNGLLMIIGLLFIAAAGGDMMIVWVIRKVPTGRLVEDHPTRGGCYVLEPVD